MLIDKVFENNWKDDFKINFTIPTYNRIENLILIIKNFNKFTNQDFGIIILDNKSSDFDFTIITNLLNNSKFGSKIYINKKHIGPDANVLRSMQLAVSEWVFLTGDSKILRPDTVEISLKNINQFSNLSSIVYSFDEVSLKSQVLNSLENFFKSKIKFGDLFLGGNSIVKKSSFDQFLAVASQLTLSRSMLTIFHILNLNNNNNVLFSSTKVIEKFISKPEKKYNPGFSLLECWAQFPLLTTLEIGQKNQFYLNKFILKNESRANYYNFIKYCLIQIIREKNKISTYLKKIINYRYVHYPYSIEKFFIYPLYFLSIIYEKIYD